MMAFKKNSLFCFSVVVAFNALHGMEPAKATELSSQHKVLLMNLKASAKQTTFTERRQYGYNGTKIPVMKGNDYYLLQSAGCIIAQAQPSMWNGYWYADSHVFSNRVFIEDNNLKYEAVIKERKSEMNIHSSCLFGDRYANTMSHKIAILWEDLTFPQKTYVTMKRLAEIQEQGNQIDLDENKVEIGMSL
jgi:hypothetical protein